MKNYEPPASEDQPRLIQNAIFIPSQGVYLKSTHVHDYVGHEWVEGGKTCSAATDGGCEYLRRAFTDQSLYEDWSLYDDDMFVKVAEKFLWKTFGPKGDQPGKWVPLSLCETDHLEAILKTQSHIRGGLIEKIVKYLLEKRLEKQVKKHGK